MQDKIVNIHGQATTRAGVPQQSCIDDLTDLLERAKSGELQQLAFVWVDRHGLPTDGYSPGAHPQELIPIIGGLELCKATLLSQMVGA